MKPLYQIALVGAILFSPTAYGDTDNVSIELNGYSIHGAEKYWDKNRKIYRSYNSFNRGIGVKYGLTEYLDMVAGGYKNSYYKTSFYGGVVVKKDFHFDNVRVTPGVKVGLVTGYDGTENDRFVVGPMKTLPMIVPTLEFGYDNKYVSVGFVPDLVDDSVWVAMFQLGFRIK